MEQITLNFDAGEYDAFDYADEFFAHASRSVKDDEGRTVKQAAQAMVMDYSPTQWSQKLNRSNNTAVSLRDADIHTERFGGTDWICFLYYKHVIKPIRGEDVVARLERELAAAKKMKGRK
jgi:hypothetical protein